MSGIINSAGSKSGVIGTTELDYEEGSHVTTSLDTEFTMDGTYDTLHYVKIGNLVTITGYLYIGGVTGSPTRTRFTLPFTCADAPEYSTSQAVGTYEVDYDGTSYGFLRIDQGANFMMGYAAKDNGAWTKNHASIGDIYLVNLTYRIAG